MNRTLRFIVLLLVLTCFVYFGFAAVGMGSWSGLRIPIWDSSARGYWPVKLDPATLTITGDPTVGYTLSAPGTSTPVRVPVWRRERWELTSAQIATGITLAYAPINAQSVTVHHNKFLMEEGLDYILSGSTITFLWMGQPVLSGVWNVGDTVVVTYQSP